MNKTYLFISDIHLGLESKEAEKEKERLLVKFLYFAADNCDELFIVGDLFDYWFEYKRVYQKGFFRTLTAMQDLIEKGIKVHYIIGNHDFMHRDFFVEEIGASLYEDAIEKELNGRKFFIAHGDGLIKNDYGYNILKKIMRNKAMQKLYSFVHPDIGVMAGSSTSKKSREHTTKKDYGERDGLSIAAKEIIEKGFDYVIFGHLHQRRDESHPHSNGTGTGRYINLGSWLEKPCYGIYKDNNFVITDWK